MHRALAAMPLLPWQRRRLFQSDNANTQDDVVFLKPVNCIIPECISIVFLGKTLNFLLKRWLDLLELLLRFIFLNFQWWCCDLSVHHFKTSTLAYKGNPGHFLTRKRRRLDFYIYILVLYHNVDLSLYGFSFVKQTF